MGATHSTPTHRYTTRHYDWEKETGAYVPYRYQRPQRDQWRREERQAYLDDRRAKGMARAQAHRERKEARRERYRPVRAQKREFRRQYDEFVAAKAGRAGW